MSKSLLIELFVEELPPKALKKLGEAFAEDIFYSLRRLNFTEAGSVKTCYASPRRLAVHVSKVLDKCPDTPLRKKLIPIELAYDTDGNISVALLKRLEKENANLADTKRSFEDGKEYIYLEKIISGSYLEIILGSIIDASISNLPIPKVMTYQLADGWESIKFVRPAHGLVALHGETVVPVSALGLNASNQTHGHRFEAQVDPVVLRHADSYAEQLQTEGAVIASFAERRAEIVRQLTAAAAAQNLKPIDDDALLDEVTALVERPNVLLGQFEEIYLEVPQECLILTMKANQKYFPLLDANGKLTNKFLIVSNISPTDASAVIGGNERVVRPRLADAKFFFDQDRKKTLESRLEGLNKVVYHNKLGSQGERTARVAAIAKAIGQQLGGDALANKAELAAMLAKADLVTDMVGEFPELQGIMGRYYAQHEGLDNEVAFAIEDHYKPRFAGDELPRNQVGICVALADKLETLAGLFSIGEKPTGDKDPFGLRRQSLGVIRIIIENRLELNTDELVNIAFTQFRSNAGTDLLAFIADRLNGYCRELDYTANEVESVTGSGTLSLAIVPKQLSAVRAFLNLPEAQSLAAANKRVSNILKKADTDLVMTLNEDLLVEISEKELYEALKLAKPKADKLFESGDYTASMQSLASLKAPVDAFFDNVMVNADDPALKANRLGLLATLHQTMNRVADLSKLAS